MLTNVACETQLEVESECRAHHAPVVKNTFIALLKPSRKARKCETVPADMRLLLESLDFSTGSKLTNSEVSTDASGDECNDMDVASLANFVPAPSFVRSNTKSCWRHQYRKKYDAVIKRVGTALTDSDLIAGVNISDSSQECSIVLQVREDVDAVAYTVLEFAQKTLLEVTTKSKCIYIMGYCTPQAFTRHPYGFEATLGAMENATTACWYFFKRGVCRHDGNCSKQHAIYKVPVRVSVERV
jgi:hypothetical protein